VLNYVEGNPKATIVADLTDAPHIPDNTFDCVVITQTLQMIFEADKAIATLHRILGDVFGRENIDVSSYGNILTTIASLHGLAASEIDPTELDHNDPDYELLVMVRAVKA